MLILYEKMKMITIFKLYIIGLYDDMMALGKSCAILLSVPQGIWVQLFESHNQEGLASTRTQKDSSYKGRASCLICYCCSCTLLLLLCVLWRVTYCRATYCFENGRVIRKCLLLVNFVGLYVIIPLIKLMFCIP